MKNLLYSYSMLLCQVAAPQLDWMFDIYRETSIKNAERDRRKS